jgi:glycosyltransferase involved in cell wall biosynthesis
MRKLNPGTGLAAAEIHSPPNLRPAMTRPERLSVCYVEPGRDFRPGSSHSRQVLALGRALARRADVSVVFRRLAGQPAVEGCAVSALEPGAGLRDRSGASRQSLGRFVERRAADYGVILEAGWSMPGKLTAWCSQRGIRAIPVLDGLAPTSWLGPLDPGSGWLGLVSSGRHLRRAPVVVAASPVLRDAIVERWRIDPARIVVIGPAIDRTVFSPRDQVEARRQLGMDPAHRIVLAGDGLGPGPDLSPLVEAVQRAGDPALRLHVLGEGERLPALRRLAGSGPSVTFHGSPPDDVLAAYIAAADLCLSVGQSGDSCFTPLECFSSARPVAVAGALDRAHLPIQPLVNGFVVEHDLLAWIRFLQRDCPSRNALRVMGMAASGTPIEPVDRIAVAYLAAIDRALAEDARRAAVV